MEIACPNCRSSVPVPSELMQRGVARIVCEDCEFSFTMRLGEPADSKQSEEERDPLKPVEVEGMKHSGAISATAGEIGAESKNFVPAMTRTSIKLSPELLAMIAEDEEKQTHLQDGHAKAFVESITPPPNESKSDPINAVSSTQQESNNNNDTFESYGEVSATMSTPVSREPLQQLTPLAITPSNSSPSHLSAPFQNVLPSSSQVVTEPLSTIDSDALQNYDLAPPRESAAVQTIGKIMFFSIIALLLFGLFVLIRNDWTLDFQNLDKMMNRAFGGQKEESTQEFEISSPSLEEVILADKKKALVAKGLLKNLSSKTKRYIYVQATLFEGSLPLNIQSTPAGNLFSKEELKKLTFVQLNSRINPAGRNGRNAKLLPQASIDYMIAFPLQDKTFNPNKHRVTIKILSSETYQGP